MSDTPETDALEYEVADDYGCAVNVVSSCLARKLERERNELRCMWITDKIEKESHPREIICKKCGLREQRGILPDVDF